MGSLFFDATGAVVDYRMVLTGTSGNCGGGMTPWGTWISCEGGSSGQMYEVDPSGERGGERTALGIGQDFTYDDRDPSRPRFYYTEGRDDGAVRRFTPHPDTVAKYRGGSEAFNMLHSDLGTFEYLVLQSQMGNLTHSRGTHQWSTSFARGRQSAQIYYPRTEGIDCHDGRLFFVSKERKEQFVLDLDDETFTTTTTVSGMFDQIAYTRNGIVDKGDGKGKGRRILSKGSKGQPMLFFLEESGGRKGIHARDRLGNYHTILEGQDANWVETTGLAFSPDRRHMYFAFQQEGLLYDVWREDGGRFDAEIHRADYDS